MSTVHLETTDGLDFKTPKFPHHVIDSRYRLDKGNLYICKKIENLGIRKQLYKGVIGPFGIDNRNMKGRRLLSVLS